MQESHWFLPQNTEQLTHFYFYICAAYMVIHFIWDHCAEGTPSFGFDKLPSKVGVLYSSTTFSTSMFFVVILFDIKNPLRTSDAFIFPLIIACGTGLLISLADLAPKPTAKIPK